MLNHKRLDDIREAVRQMRSRYAGGQGDATSAMCRLSINMSEDLLNMIDQLLLEIE